jgi:shikimate dehydrogenase
MELLGQLLELETVDIPANSSAAVYQSLVMRLGADPTVCGAVITAHKRAVYDHAVDLLAGADPLAHALGEISVLYRRDGELYATVIDSASINATLLQMGGDDPVTTDQADTVVYGAGGTAIALIACLAADRWPAWARPRLLHLVDTSAARLGHAGEIASRQRLPLPLCLYHSSGEASLADLGPLPDRSLIVNATGLGKDRPGSPVRLPAPWPSGAHVWDLNYRGRLLMLEDARAAAAQRRLTVHNGWLLFINGWAEALAAILGQPIQDEKRRTMDQLAWQAHTG